MADRIADVPDDADWPEIEEDMVPDRDVVPDAGPFERPFEYLHGARVTLDSDLGSPTKLLAATAARSILRVADETDTGIDPAKRERFTAIANAELSTDEDDLVEALAELTAFVEAHISPPDELSPPDDQG
jgi:hypothetical protein